MKRLLGVIAVTLVSAMATGCSATLGGLSPDANAASNASKAQPPRPAQHEDTLLTALSCFAGSSVTNNIFLVMPTQDATSKVNAVAEGSTGALLSQDASPFIIQALGQSGARMRDFSDRAFEASRRLREQGGPIAAGYIAKGNNKHFPRYIITGSFAMLDFTGKKGGDVRVAGIGPYAKAQGVTVTAFVHVLDSQTLDVIAQSDPIRQFVSYQEIGVGVGKVFSKTLVTGEVGISNQQQLQYEAARRPLMHGVLQVISRIPGAPSGCRDQAEAVVSGRAI